MRVTVLPIGLSNPMAKSHALACCDALHAMDAEGLAREAAAEAERLLARVPGDLRIGFSIADDVAGGWTDRALTEMKHRFDNARAVRTSLGCALLWAGEPPTRDGIRAAVLAECYRHARVRAHGPAETLETMLLQEGRAACMADAVEPPLSPQEARRARETTLAHGHSNVTGVQIACLYGDEAAARAGYVPLGLPHRAGYALALEDARKGPPPRSLVGAGQ